MTRTAATPALTPGRLLYLVYHRPLAALVRTHREGGPWQQWLDARGRRDMIAAARMISPHLPAPSTAPEVYFLTGARFWYQTAFCLASLSRHFGPVRPVLIDDGSFDAALEAEVLRVFPSARIERATDLVTHLDSVLPAKKFPALRAQRLTYVHLRKLVDVHAGRHGYRVVLDSDMLFFRHPTQLASWFAGPDRPVHMLDVQDSYGYPSLTLNALAGRPVPSLVNVGICGFRSDNLDWEKIEYWTAQLLARHGTSYYLEQALVALLLADANPLRLQREDYRLLPDLAECRRPTAALHHYVDLSKRGYFRHAWRPLTRSLP